MNTKIHTPSRCIMSVATWGLALLAMSGLTGCADSGQGGVASPVAPPTQHYAYVANQTDNAISIYKIDTATGKLEANGSVSVGRGTGPTLVAVDPSNRFAYVANNYSHTVSAYRIDTTTGALTPNGAPVGAGLNPISLKVDPTGRFLYVANQGGGVSAFSINSDGTLKSIGDVAAGVEPFSVAVEPTGRFVYVTSGDNSKPRDPADPAYDPTYIHKDDIHAFSIHATTGVLTPVGVPVPAPAIPVNITVGPFGKFAYVASGISSSVTAFAINNTTGALTLVGTLPTGGSAPRAVAVESSGRFAYVVNVGSNDVSIFSINPTTGTLTPIPVNPIVAAAPGAHARFLTVDATGKFVYVTYFDFLYVSTFSINPATGELTDLGTEPTGAGSVGITVTNAL